MTEHAPAPNDQASAPFDLDALFAAMPGGTETPVEPRWCRNPDFCGAPRWVGLKIGVPIKAYRAHLAAHKQALQDGPVLLFGRPMRCTGWSVRILPATPIRSADQLVWLDFDAPDEAERLCTGGGRYPFYTNLNGLP